MGELLKLALSALGRGGGILHPKIHSYWTFQLSWPKLIFHIVDWMCLYNWWASQGGWLPSNHFWFLKRTLELSISNRPSSFRSFYDKSFWTKCLVKKKTLCPLYSLSRQHFCAAYYCICITVYVVSVLSILLY